MAVVSMTHASVVTFSVKHVFADNCKHMFVASSDFLLILQRSRVHLLLITHLSNLVSTWLIYLACLWFWNADHLNLNLNSWSWPFLLCPASSRRHRCYICRLMCRPLRNWISAKLDGRKHLAVSSKFGGLHWCHHTVLELAQHSCRAISRGNTYSLSSPMGTMLRRHT
jgi:hypothetical protein